MEEEETVDIVAFFNAVGIPESKKKEVADFIHELYEKVLSERELA